MGPGFRRFTIRPYPVSGLEWARAEYASMYGLIRSAWRRENGAFTLAVTVPPNSTATVWVPAAGPARITEGGRPAASAPGVRFLRRQEGATVFEVGSGTHEFVSR